MPASQPSDAATTTETLQRLVADCLDLLEAEGPPAVEAFLELHPEHAEQVRSRLSRLQEAGLLASREDARPFPERLGPFRLIERLGGGGMGVVYLAEQEPLGRRVALKLVRPDMLYFESARERFRREVEVVARLKHPGIVPVYTVGEEQGIPFYSMEYVEGRSLDDLLRTLRGRDPSQLTGRDVLEAVGDAGEPVALESGRPLAEASWVDVCFHLMLQLVRALEHAHGRGVLHRDLKPSNVMLTPGARVLLLDFGLASTRGTSRLTRTGSQVGSLPYMAPEQLLGRQLDERTDLYAIGVTLYELLGLRLPYFARDPEETRRRILDGVPRPLQEENRSVPWDAETVCLTAMERDAARRYPSARALADDLRAVLRRMPIAARRLGPWLRTKRFVQRNPAWSTGAVLGALIVVGSIAFGLRQLVTSRALRGLYLANEGLVGELRAASGAKDVALRETTEALKRASAAEGRALEELEASEAILAFLNEDLLNSASPKHLGREVTVREALDSASAKIEGRFPGRPLIEAAVRTTLGGTYFDLGRPVEAERELRRARALVVAAVAEDRSVAFKNLAGLADLAFQQGRTEEARQLYAEALEGRRAVLGPEHPETLVTLANLGGMLAVSGYAPEGEPLLAVALQAMPRVLGEHDLRTLSAMSNHASALQNLGRIDEALALARRTVELSREHLGGDNGHTLMALHNLGSILASAGSFEEALPICRKALEGKVRTLGWAHPETITMADSLAACQLERGQLADARHTLEDAFARTAEAGIELGHEWLGLLHARWGELANREGRLEEAADAFALAYEGLSRHLGSEHPRTLTILGNLALALLKGGLYEEAERRYATWIENDRNGGDGSFSRRLERVDCLRELGRFEEAERELARLAETLAAGDPWARRVLERLGVLYAAWGRPEELERWRDELGPARR